MNAGDIRLDLIRGLLPFFFSLFLYISIFLCFVLSPLSAPEPHRRCVSSMGQRWFFARGPRPRDGANFHLQPHYAVPLQLRDPDKTWVGGGLAVVC